MKVTFKTDIWLIGGLTNDGPTKDTYKLKLGSDTEKASWVPSSKLIAERTNHGCATYVTGGKEVIVVAGGFGKSSKRATSLVALDTVEFFTGTGTFTGSKKAFFFRRFLNNGPK